MMVGILTLMYHLPNSHNLKNKRQTLQSFKQILRKKFNISIAEIGYHDLWQKSLIGISMISNNQKIIDKIFNKVIKEIEYHNKGYILNYHTEYMQAGEIY